MLKHRKLLAVVVIVMIISISVIGVAVALVSGPPQVDTYTNVNAPDDASGGTDPGLWTTINGDPGGGCEVSRITYLQWDLSELTPGQQIGSAAITVTRSAAIGSPTSYTLGLFEADGTVTNATTWNTAPVPGAQIETQPVPDTNGAQVTFNSQELVDYFQAQAAGDDIATFALQLVAAGPCGGANTLVLDSIEDTAGVPVRP